MKTILYATDYSENSISALRFAHILAKNFDAKLIIMHVFDIPIALASSVSVSYLNKERRLFVENRAKLKEFFTQHVGKEGRDTSTSFVVGEDSSVPNCILEKSVKLNADLICLGAKGASAAKEFLLGSTSKTLLKKVPCPVLVVPTGCIATKLNKMVYATDFEQADIFAIKKLVKIAQKFNAQIRVVHITTQEEYAGEEQMEWFKEMLKDKVTYKLLEFDLIFSNSIFEELISYVNDREADLIGMLERKDNSFYQKHLQRDLVRKMVKDSPVPLLSFNISSL